MLNIYLTYQFVYMGDVDILYITLYKTIDLRKFSFWELKLGRNILIKKFGTCRNDVNVCRHTESFVCVDIQQPIVTNQTAGGE
jgi:hypothetical protein